MEPMLAAINTSTLLWAFIWVVIAGLIFWIGNWAIAYIGIGEPFNKILKVFLVLIAVVMIINALMTIAGRPFIGN